MTVRALRLRAQRLAGQGATSVHEVVGGLVGVQAQDTRAARLAIRPRSTGLSAEAVRRACDDERSVVRTWAMRGTLHMVTAEDVGWLVALLGPIFARAGRGRRLQLGLDDDLCARGVDALRTVLADGPLPRAELVRRLAPAGVVLDPRSQAPAHLVAYAALQGVVCRGPDLRGDEPTYVLLSDWVGAQPVVAPEGALAELARRYAQGYGPAEPEDFAAWAGIGLRRARTVFRPVAPADVGEEPGVRLLPAFDNYLLGYRERAFALDPRFASRVQAGGGWIRPVVLVDGRVAGTWRQQRGAVVMEPFADLDPAVVEDEIADIGRFLR